MSFVNFNYYSFIYDEELSVEAEVDYKEPNHNDDSSDLDFYGGYDTLSLDVYHEDGEHVIVTGYKQQLLSNEVKDKLNQQLRLLEIEDSRYEASFGEINTDSIYYYKWC